ncbi:ABC transporter permease [Patescibacteria group bacterium]|nr:ABC transporter permease [Patescibacteria group bacterium]
MSTNAMIVAFYTMMRKEVVRIFRIWSQTLLPPVITTSLYFAIFGAFIGSQIQPIEGFSYMQFIMPGLVMMTVITSAYAHVSSAFFSAKFMKSLEELLVSPMPHWLIIAGFVCAGVIRSFLVSVLVIIVALMFTHITIANMFIILAAGVLTAILFSLAGLLNGIFAKGFDGITIIPNFVLTPLTYLGGIFYSIELLPEPFRTLSLGNPILYMVNAFRHGFLGISDVSLWVSFGITGLVTLILLLLTLWSFSKGTGLRS